MKIKLTLSQTIGIVVGSIAVLSALTVFGVWLSRLLGATGDQDAEENAMEMLERPNANENDSEASEENAVRQLDFDNPDYDSETDSVQSIESFQISHEEREFEPEPMAVENFLNRGWSKKLQTTNRV